MHLLPYVRAHAVPLMEGTIGSTTAFGIDYRTINTPRTEIARFRATKR